LIEGPRAGKTTPEIASDAARDAITSALSPFEGPIVRTAAIATTGMDTSGYRVGPQIAKDENAPLAHLRAAALSANPVIARLTDQTKSPIAGKFEVQEREPKSVAMQIASREAGERVPQGQQTREEMDRTQAEHGYRKDWSVGKTAPLIHALATGEVNEQRARELIRESSMSDLSRTVHHLPIETALRVYDAGTPAEKTDLKLVMLQHVAALAKSSPAKALKFIDEYNKRGLLK
jgi:hypothetical protein